MSYDSILFLISVLPVDNKQDALRNKKSYSVLNLSFTIVIDNSK